MSDPDIESLKGDEAIITIRWQRWWGLAKPKVRRYRGEGTVWYDADTGRRQPTHIERMLSDIWTKARWNRRAPAQDGDQ